MEKIRTVTRLISINLVVLLVLLFFVDFLVGLLFEPEAWMSHLGQVGYYQDKAWTPQFLLDSAKASPQSVVYSPFVLWRRQPFSSPTINIDTEGHRSVPGTNCTLSSFKIFFFGGSAAWGTGSPDWGTIPAHLQEHLAPRFKQGLCIVNYAESSWNSNQEVIQLLIAIRQNHLPDLALFYDGWNDINIAFETGSPHLHRHFRMISSKLDKKRDWTTPLKLVIPNLLKQGLLSSLFDFASLQEQKDLKDPMFLDSVASNYESNIKIASNLGKEYGFKVHFFKQPDLSNQQRKVHPDELKIKANLRLTEFVRDIDARMDQGHSDFSNLKDALNDLPGQVYIDSVHVTPEANRVLAQKIVTELDLHKKIGPTKNKSR